MSEYFVGTTGVNSQTTFESLTTSEVLDDLQLNTTDSPTFADVTANAFYGDGSNLTGLSSSTDNTKLPLTGGDLSGPLSISNSSGNTLTLKKGTGTPAIALAGTSSEASALIEGIAGGGLKLYTSNGGTLSSPSWSPKMTVLAGGRVGIGTTTPDASTLLHVQGVIGTTNGSAAAPTHSFYGDPDNGMFRAAVNTLGFSTAGTERMRINGAGDVLMGNTAVNIASNFTNQKGFGFKFSTGQTEIATTADIAALTLGRNLGSDGAILDLRKEGTVIGSFGSNTTGGQTLLDISASTSNGNMRFLTSGAERMRINSSGNITLGTASVAAANAAADDLHLKSSGSNGITISSGNAQTGTIFFGDAASSAAAGFRYNHNTGDMAISAEDNITFACDNVGIGTTSPSYLLDLESTATGLTHNLKLNKNSTTGDYAEIAFQLWSGAGTGLNTFGGSGTSRPSVVLRAINEASASAAGAFAIATFAGGSTNSTLTEKFRVTSNGNVGIGNTNPTAAKLIVRQDSGYVFRTENASGHTFRIAGDTGNIEAAGDLTVSGDLTVNGTTSTINSTTVQVDDKNIELGTVATPTDATADGGGITLKGATDKTINWVNSTDAWTFSERVSIPVGSAASPSLTFAGDTDTGIYRISADSLGITTGGALRAQFNNTGIVSSLNLYSSSGGEFRNYGGTWQGTTGLTGNGFQFVNSVDGTALTISSTGDTVASGKITTESSESVFGGSGGIPIYARSTGTVSYLQIQNSSTGSNGANDGLTVGCNGTAGYIWLREAASLNLGTNDTSAITIDSSQNTTFAGTIHVNNAASDKKIAFDRTGGKGISIEHDANGIYFYNETDATSMFRMYNAGSAQITGDLTVSGDISIAEKLIHTGDTNTYIQFPATNDKIVFATNGSDVLTLDATNTATFAGNIAMGDNDVTGVDQLTFTSGTYLTDVSSNYIELRYASTASGGIIVIDGDGSTQGYLYADGGASTPTFGLLDGTGSWAVKCRSNEYVQLLYDNAAKLQTASGGVTVTGVISATGGNSTNWNTAHTHTSATNNPHSVTKTQVGLSNVTNESKATMFASPTFTGTVGGVTKAHVGLGSVTNESKATMFTNAALTGNPTATTQSSNENSTKIATTAYVKSLNYITSLGNALLKTGGTMTGDLVVEDSEIHVGDKSNDEWTRFLHTSENGYGFTWQHTNASVFVNEQGSTNQVMVLGDVDAGNSNSGLFGIGHSGNGGTSWTKKLDLRGDGDLYIGSSGTSKVFHDGYHPNADILTTTRNIALSGDVTGNVNFNGSANVSIATALAVNSVGSSEIGPDEVGASEIAANAVGASELNVSGNGTATQYLRSDGDGTFTWFTPPDTNTTYDLSSYATQSYVGTQITNLIDSSPAALNTLNELAFALGDDANFSTTITNSIATKAPLASPSFTGDVVITDDTFPFIRSSTHGATVGIKFSDDQVGSYAQHGTLTFQHADGASYGSGASFILGTNQTSSTILADGKLMYGEGIYSKPATGTGAGARKDSNWDTAFTHTSATNNPHSVTKSQVGLSNVTNESKATMFASPTFTGTVGGVTKAHVGLGSVANESKATMFTNAALTGNPTATTQSSNENSTKIATTAYVKSQGYITTDNNTFRSVTAGGNTLGSTETLAFTAGSNVTITESAGAVTIAVASHSHAASDITSGTLADARIPSLAASKITSGTFADARIPSLAASKITSGTFADARIAGSNVTQHQAALSITESQISNFGSYATAGDENIIDGATSIWNADGDGDVFVYNDSNPTHNGKSVGAVINIRGDGTADSSLVRAGLFTSNLMSTLNGYYVGALLGNANSTTTQVINSSGAWTGSVISAAKLSTATTQSSNENSTKIATTAYVKSQGYNNYTHPTHTGDDINIDTGALTGATVISDLDFNVTTNTLGHVTDANGTVATRTLTAANLGISAPNAPASASAAIVGNTVEVTFAASTTSGIDSYLVYSSIDGSDYGLISIVPPDDFAASMSIIDNAFDETGTQAYRVYAMKYGILSSAASDSISYTVSSAEPTTMSVVNLNNAYYVQWNPPSANARFVTAYNVYKHEHATQGSLSRSSASLLYSGMNTNYMYQISGTNNSNFHQFWVETTIA